MLWYSETGVQVINFPAVHPTKSRGNAIKKVDYLPLLLFHSLQSHGIATVARLQREEVSRSAKENGELVGFLHDFTRSLHPLSNFANDFEHDRSHGKCSQIYWKYCIIDDQITHQI
jgi:hypothetical protein